jgi:Spy/CpxP family protein refolding chaperone
MKSTLLMPAFTQIYTALKRTLQCAVSLGLGGSKPMKFNKKLLSVAGAGLLTFGTIVASAQAIHHHGPMAAQAMQNRLTKLSAAVNLTDAQKTAAQQIFAKAQESAKPLRQQLRQTHQALNEAVKAGKPASDLQAITSQQGAVMGQLAEIRAEAFSNFYAQLTPDQKAKAGQMRQSHNGRRFQHPNQSNE